MGPYMTTPKTEKQNFEGTGKYKYGTFEWASAAMQGWRNTMEDAHIHNVDIDGTGVSVFGVFDGHGGEEVAKFVEKYFVQELIKTSAFKEKKYAQALSDTFYRMDELLETNEGRREIQQMKSIKSENSFAGCTANVILIYEDQLFCANAGDARSVLCQGKSGKSLALSEDHKPLLEKEKKRIEDAGGHVNLEGRVNGNLNLSRAIGDLEYKQQKKRSRDQQLIIATPDIKEYTIQADDQYILMGCDGIWETMENDQILSFIGRELGKNQQLTQSVNNYLDHILAKDTNEGLGCDNMSAILIRFRK